MPSRQPPSWFVAKLKAIDRRLTVHWHEAKERWVVAEMVPWMNYVGVSGGASLYRALPHPQRVVFAAELGSGVLEWVRRLQMSRFDGVEHMETSLNL